MSNFVLVHGSWHGAWCWYKIVPRLRALGHQVEAIDLPGHGRERTDPAEVTLDSYADRIGAAIERAPGPVVVVAHSRGGIPTSQAAELWHERIARLVYLAAYLLADGESVLDHVVHDSDAVPDSGSTNAGRSRPSRVARKRVNHPARILQLSLQTKRSSRADPAGGRRKLPPKPAYPRKAVAKRPCSRR